MIVEAVGGLLTGSLALLADAGHMLTDTAALGLAWLGFRMAQRAPDRRRSFGYARFEVLAGLVNALALFAVIAWILWEALQRLQNPTPVLAGPMMLIALLGLAVNGIAFWLLHADADHVNVRGALVHVLGDLLGSIAAITAALVIMATDWMLIDPLLSVLVGLLVLRSAWALLRQTAYILLEGTPEDIDGAALARTLAAQVPGVRDVHHVHLWSLTSGRPMATLHVRLGSEGTVAEALPAIKRLLAARFRIEHSTVQICPEHCPDEQPGDTACAADPEAQ